MHEPSRSSVSDLASFFMKMKDPGSLIIAAVATSGVGKTCWHLELVCQVRRMDLSPTGLISPAVGEVS